MQMYSNKSKRQHFCLSDVMLLNNARKRKQRQKRHIIKASLTTAPEDTIKAVGLKFGISCSLNNSKYGYKTHELSLSWNN